MDVIDFYKSLIADHLSKRSNSCWMDPIVKYTLTQKKIEDAIYIAVMSRDKTGRKHSHQWRIYDHVYENFSQNLLNVRDKIENSKNFDELLNIIDEEKPSGAGELFCYDTAVRIGHYLNLFPEKIYLHAGTRKGLEALLKRKIYGKTINKNNLPEPFKSCKLSPGQLEDFFCIYKEYLSGNRMDIKQLKEFGIIYKNIPTC